MDPRSLSALDRALGHLDQAVRHLFGPAPASRRPDPAANIADTMTTENQRRASGRLMRVNHSGEVCAQALYLGQAMTARRSDVQSTLEQAASEEHDHLAWTNTRVQELGTHTSYLNPVWYAGSLAIGALAGLAGDKWSLGFLAETEHQVVEHLTGHRTLIPLSDAKSHAIIEQMREDEGRHATTAVEAGGAPLPGPVKQLMRIAAKVMTSTAYWI